MHKLVDRTFLRFLIVGVINTLFGTGLMFLLYNFFGWSYWWASASNYFFGSILSYFLNKHFTFQQKERDWSSLVRFAINISICYVLAYGLAKPFTRWALGGLSISLQENLAMLVGMVLFTLLNYFGQRYWAFKKA